MPSWSAFDDADAVARAAADFVLACAAEAVAKQGEFRLVLAGGTTPLACYRLLAGNACDRSQWKLFYGDERCLPESHAERNHRLVEATGLTRGVAGHYVIPGEKGAESGARQYAETIEHQLPFDLVLLGMGEDGHTASLFPGHERELSDNRLVVPVYDSPKAPAERVSLTLGALKSCTRLLLLVTGEGKREALRRWREGEDLPVSRVSAFDGVQVYLEKSLLEG